MIVISQRVFRISGAGIFMMSGGEEGEVGEHADVDLNHDSVSLSV